MKKNDPKKDILERHPIAYRVKSAVKKAGGNKTISAKTGIPLNTLSNYTTGRSEIKVANLIAIAVACDVSIEWLAIGKAQSPAITYPVTESGQANPEKPGLIDSDFFMTLWRETHEAHEKYAINVTPDDFTKIVIATYNGACDAELEGQPNAVRYKQTKELYEKHKKTND